MLRTFSPSLACALSLGTSAWLGLGRDGTAAPVDYGREIQPILSENCYQCHGPDSKARKAELRLDRKEGLYRTKDGITVVAPGKASESDLVDRIFSDDPDEQMPPRKSHRSLSATQKGLIKRWVEEGAVWGEHWAFVAPKRPEVPEIADHGFVIRNPIDAFIAQRLLREGLPQSPEAPRAKLLRRVTLDLTGLPPTPAGTRRFLA